MRQDRVKINSSLKKDSMKQKQHVLEQKKALYKQSYLHGKRE